jgi:hypothetical protein
MNRLHSWTTLPAFALLLAAAATPAQEAPPELTLTQATMVVEKGCCRNAFPDTIGSWKFQAAEQDGKPCLCIQAGPDTQATCEEMTFHVGSVGRINLKAAAGQVQVRGAGVEARADCVMRTGKAGTTLELLGKVQLKYQRNGQHAELKAEKVVVDLAAGRLEIGPCGEGTASHDPSDRTASPACPRSVDLVSGLFAKSSSTVRTVRVRVIYAGSPIPGINGEELARDLTHALVREIEMKTPLKVVEKNADLELTVTITGITKRITDYIQQYEVREAEVKLLAEVTCRDLRTAERHSCGEQKPLPSSQGDLTRPERLQAVSYFRPELGESITEARTRAVDRLAAQTVALMETAR